jgi:curved DNA-binding protein
VQIDVRRHPRRAARGIYSISWHDQDGLTKAAHVEGVHISDAGIGFKSSVELHLGIAVFIQGPDGHPKGYGVVRHCTRSDAGYVIGLEFDDETRKTLKLSAEGAGDYYELLQISPKAEPDTIHRVYRFLAARYHPDNPETGDPEKFLALQSAFDTLVDPERRREYDVARQDSEDQAIPLSPSIDFMDGIQGEVNRRLALLSLLYRRRRVSPQSPELSLAEAESRMGFPRDYLDFSIWYLKNKKYITVGDSSSLALTALGVDYVETNCASIPILNRLLEAGTSATTGPQAETGPKDLDSSEPVLLPDPGEDVN